MREIKFRAWDESRQKFIKGDMSNLMLGLSGMTFWQFANDAPEPIPNKFPLQQYTGLKDKNSVEIYEGDILREYDEVVDPFRNDDSKDYTTDRLHEVRYLTGNKDDGFRCVSQPTAYYTEDNYYTTWIDSRTMEVIGNIYENPELLKAAS